jgi:hypothetical protein
MVCREVEEWFERNPGLFRLDWLFRDNTWVTAIPLMDLDQDPLAEAWGETMEEKVEDWLESVKARFPGLSGLFLAPLGRYEMTRGILDFAFSHAYDKAFGMDAWARDNVWLEQARLHETLAPATTPVGRQPRL